jgi:serine phosphatase RsbU (regulator of sigma subunit)
MFGEGRLRDAIFRTRGMDSKTIMDKILDEVNEFCGDYPQSDDITLMIIRVGEQ